MTLRLFTTREAEEACDFLTGLLGTNPLLLRELDLSGKIQGDSGLKQVAPLLGDSQCNLTVLKLNNNSITGKGISDLASALRSNPSHLIELDLSGNQLTNSAVDHITPLLQDSSCTLKKLKFSDCSITGEGYAALAEALKSNSSSQLVELDLRMNNPGDEGVKLLTDIQNNPKYALKTLKLLKSSASENALSDLLSSLNKNPLLEKELKLSKNTSGISGDSRVEKLSAVLQDSYCKLETLQINNDDLTEKSCSSLAAALSLESSCLKELDLSYNNLQDSGVRELCKSLENPLCNLQILRLADCSITGEGYAALAEAVKSSSNLLELDLRGNDPGDEGVKLLTDLFVNSYFSPTKKKLRLLKNPGAEEACISLNRIIGKNSLLEKELDLSNYVPKYIKINNLSALLEDPHYRLQKLQLCNCSITPLGCVAIALALCKNPCHKELDLSGNKVGNLGVKKLSQLLQNSVCNLEKLKLSGCSITGEGYAALTSALKSNPSSQLRELDLRGNDPGDEGVKLLTDVLKNQHSKITVRLLKTPAAEEACDYLTELLDTDPLLLKELDLSGKLQGDSGVKKLCPLLEDPHCRVKELWLDNNSITGKGISDLASALCSNPSHLIELDLSGNQLTNSGVNHFAPLLKDSSCKLTKLRLSNCSITEEGYAALASALKSNPSSQLVELDLRGNDPGDEGVKLLTEIQNNPKYALKTLKLLKSSAEEEALSDLFSSLNKNPLLEKELKLYKNTSGISGDSRVEKLSAVLQDSHCKLETLQINNDDLTEKSCSSLAAVLSSESSCLKELDLSYNNLQDSGVKELCNALKNPLCKLQVLRLADCKVTGEGYAALAEALNSNPSSQLVELDLRGNDPGDEGVKLLIDTNQFYQQRKLKLLKSRDAENAWACLTMALNKNPLLERELDLSNFVPKDINVNQFSALLEDPHYRLQKLTLYEGGSIKEEDCAVLASALTANPSHIRELNLNGNNPGERGTDELCRLLKNPHCKLERLNLRKSIKETTCAALASALCSNPSHIRELDLSENDLGVTGMKNLFPILENSECKLEKLLLQSCSIGNDGTVVLTAALRSNCSNLRVLDLRGNKLGESVKELFKLLNTT